MCRASSRAAARTSGERSAGVLAGAAAVAVAALPRRHPLRRFRHSRYRCSVGSLLRSTCDQLLLTAAAARILPSSSSSSSTLPGHGITGAIVSVSIATGIATGER